MTPICDQLIAIAAKCGYRINGNTIQDILIAFDKAIDNDPRKNQPAKSQFTSTNSQNRQYKRKETRESEED